MTLVVVGGGGYYEYQALFAGGDSESGGNAPDTYTGEGRWVGQLVNKKISCKNKFNGTVVDCTAKVYAEKQSDWENPRGDFTDSSKYEIELKDVVVAEGNQLPVKIEITANTGDYTGANDEVWVS